MTISDDPDLRVIIYVADPSSDSLDRTRRLTEQATADPLATNGRGQPRQRRLLDPQSR